jgi:hypothetical protein
MGTACNLSLKDVWGWLRLGEEGQKWESEGEETQIGIELCLRERDFNLDAESLQIEVAYVALLLLIILRLSLPLDSDFPAPFRNCA